MIKLYPVLVANSVSKNIIPGILKAIERFALIYKLDSIAKNARKDLGISLRKVGKKVVIKEETDQQLVNFLTNEILVNNGLLLEQLPGWHPNQRMGGGTKQTQKGGAPKFTHVGSDRSDTSGEFSQRQKQGQTQQQQVNVAAPAAPNVTVAGHTVNVAGPTVNMPTPAAQVRMTPDEEREVSKQRELGKEYAKSMTQAADATISIGQMDMQSLMLEPTWMKVDVITKYGQKYTNVIGVKAVATAVKSDAKLAQILMFDKQVGRLMHRVLSMGRSVSGVLYRLYARTVQRVFDPDPHAISGNPYKDIVLKRTIIEETHVDDVFLVLNQADLAEDFIVNPKGIRKLMRLGWQSFCIADDVNRRLAFCMSEFKGMCQVIPYTMLYQTLNQARVFEDLEDVRRSSASLFKRGRAPFKKVIGENLAARKLEEFSADLFPPEPTQHTQEMLNEISYIDENFATIIKKVLNSPKQFILRALKGTIKIPQPGLERMLKIGRKLDPKFVKAHTLAKKVLTNSLKAKGVNEKYLDLAAFAIVLRAKTLKVKDLVQGTREVLMSIVPIFRRVIRKAQATTMNIPPEHRVEFAIGFVSLFSIVTTIIILQTIALVTAIKIKPGIDAAFSGVGKLITFAGLTIKKWFLGAMKSLDQADIETSSQKELIGKFWKDFYTKTKTETSKMFGNSKEEVKEMYDDLKDLGETKAQSFDDWLDQFNLNPEDVGAYMILAVVVLFMLKYILLSGFGKK